jgi:hypothetical protein
LPLSHTRAHVLTTAASSIALPVPFPQFSLLPAVDDMQRRQIHGQVNTAKRSKRLISNETRRRLGSTRLIKVLCKCCTGITNVVDRTDYSYDPETTVVIMHSTCYKEIKEKATKEKVDWGNTLFVCTEFCTDPHVFRGTQRPLEASQGRLRCHRSSKYMRQSIQRARNQGS